MSKGRFSIRLLSGCCCRRFDRIAVGASAKCWQVSRWSASDERFALRRFTAEAGPGDFIYVPPYVPHQEINASRTETLECVLVRSDGEAVAINLDIAPAEPPENVPWIDPTHPA